MKGFFKISKVFGAMPEHVQGAGGNVSVKKGSDMFVKASGVFLKDICSGNGYVVCNHKPIRKFLFDLKRVLTNPESKLNFLIEELVKKSGSEGVASIETGMHAILPSRYVLHTHTVYVNVLLCMEGGKKVLQDLFNDLDFLYMPYHNPGFFISFALANKIKSLKNVPSIIFLENHGLIVHHNDSKKVTDLTNLVTNRVKDYLKQNNFNQKFSIKSNPRISAKHLFPDSVVFKNIDIRELSTEKKKAYLEIFSASDYIHQVIKDLKKEPVYIKSKDIKYIRGMDKEKLRIKKMV